LSFAFVARGSGPEWEVPGARVIDVAPRRITLRIYQSVQRLRLKRKRRLTFRIATLPNALLPAMTPSLYKTEQYLG